MFQTSRRCLDGAARYVTSHVNSTARGQRSGGSQWGGGAQLLSGNLCVANRVSGSEIQCNLWPKTVSCVLSVIASDSPFGDRIRLSARAGALLGFTFAPASGW